MNVLFLDDCQYRRASFQSRVPFAVIVETAEEALEKLNGCSDWDYIFLDHDLGGETYVDSNRPDTGMEVVRWLATNKIDVKYSVIVHSLNRNGADTMVDMLISSGYTAVRIPFTALLNIELLDTINDQRYDDENKTDI